MKEDNRPIGIFDSGLGGLTVASAIRNILPSEQLIYLGDTARVPYGSKSSETIEKYSIENSEFLMKFGVKAIVVACNTAAALSINSLRLSFPGIPFISVVEAGVQACFIDKVKKKNIVIIATSATVNSDEYRKRIHTINKEIIVQSIACPLFVPMIEEGRLKGEIPELICQAYLKHLDTCVDQLLLGCTHYPLLKDTIKNVIPENVTIIDSAQACAENLKIFLNKNNITASAENLGSERFFVTDMPGSFFKIASSFWEKPILHVDKINLDF